MKDADKILKAIQELREQTGDFWRVGQIATCFNCSKSTVQNRIITHPTFPRERRLPTGRDGGRGGPMWKASEVRAWPDRYTIPKPSARRSR